jgi:predicted O-methyltransferase YrrM
LFAGGRSQGELRKLIDEHGTGSFDMAFIDADKTPMLDYLELCLNLVRPGGLILADNTLWNGDVADPSVDDKNTRAIREFNVAVAWDARVECTLVNIADGIMVMRKK